MHARPFRLLSVAALVTGAFTIASATPALAADPDAHAASALQAFTEIDRAPDPEKAYSQLNEAERADFDDHFLPMTSEETVTVKPLDATATRTATDHVVSRFYDSTAAALARIATARGCWGSYAKFTSHAAAGNAIWDVYTEGTWCSNGSAVTSASFSRSWSTIAAPGWRDGGQLGKGAGVVSNQARMWSQRKMIFGAGGWDLQTQQPCGRLNGSAAGKASATAACSIY